MRVGVGVGVGGTQGRQARVTRVVGYRWLGLDGWEEGGRVVGLERGSKQG